MKWFTAALLALGVFRHYGWDHVPVDAQRFVWNMSGSVLILFLIWSAWPAARLVVVWLSFEELQVVACSLIRILRPQDISIGKAQCSDLIGFDLGTVGLFLVALILAYQTVRTTGYKTGKKKP